MKKIVAGLLAGILVAMSTVSMGQVEAASDAEQSYVQADGSAYFIKQKMTVPLPDHKWDSVKTDLSQDAGDNLVITKKQLDAAKPGTVLATRNLEDGCKVTVSVPEVRVDGVRSSQLDKYGVVQVLGITNDFTEDYTAATDFYLYDKNLLTDSSPLIFSGKDCWAITNPVPYAPRVDMASVEKFTLANDPGSYTARVLGFGQFGYGGGVPVPDGTVVRFANEWISFDAETFQDILEWADNCMVGKRANASSFWNWSKTEYDLLGQFGFNAKMAGQLGLTRVDQDFYYISSTEIPTSAIVLQPDSITIVATESVCMDLEEDRLWIGEYFKDTAKNSGTVSIKGTDLTLTRATAEALVSLLDENGVNWWSMNLGSLAAHR